MQSAAVQPGASSPASCNHLLEPGEPERRSSRFRGLAWDKKHRSWRVRIFYHGKQRHVGRFKCDVAAARAYDKAAVFLYGERAILNFSMGEALRDPSEVSGFICLAKEQACSLAGSGPSDPGCAPSQPLVAPCSPALQQPVPPLQQQQQQQQLLGLDHTSRWAEAQLVGGAACHQAHMQPVQQQQQQQQQQADLWTSLQQAVHLQQHLAAVHQQQEQQQQLQLQHQQQQLQQLRQPRQLGVQVLATPPRLFCQHDSPLGAATPEPGTSSGLALHQPLPISVSSGFTAAAPAASCTSTSLCSSLGVQPAQHQLHYSSSPSSSNSSMQSTPHMGAELQKQLLLLQQHQHDQHQQQLLRGQQPCAQGAWPDAALALLLLQQQQQQWAGLSWSASSLSSSCAPPTPARVGGLTEGLDLAQLLRACNLASPQLVTPQHFA